MIKNILFDLDGTLINCRQLQLDVLRQVFTEFNADTKLVNETLIGPPLINTFAKYLGEESKDSAMKKYSQIYKNIGIHNVKLMPNIQALLKSLKELNYHLFVTSLQISEVVTKELKMLGIDTYFDCIYGDNVDKPFTNKIDLIENLIQDKNLDKQETLVVGDTINDLLGGIGNGLKILAVGWGYSDNSQYDFYAKDTTTLLSKIKDM